VYVTLGTFANQDLAMFRLVLRVLASLPIGVLVTAGDDSVASALAEDAERAGNAVVVGFVPQAAVLPHCDAVLHHAGAGTTFGVLAHGLPSVALPQGADNFSIARRLATIGVAPVLMPAAVTEGAVRVAVQQALGDPAYRHRAGQLAAEIAAMPTPAQVIPTLRSVATARIASYQADSPEGTVLR